MRTTIEKPIRAGELPDHIRGNLDPDRIVRVSLETVLTENGFTPEQEAAILATERETDGEKVFDRWDDAIAYLKARRPA